MTTEQRSLFDLPVLPYGGAVPHVATDTSAAAAVAIAPKVGPWQRRVLLCLLEFGACSDETIERLLDCQQTRTSRPRRRELELAGLVEDAGLRVKSAITGAQTICWQLTAAGEAKAIELRKETRHDP